MKILRNKKHVEQPKTEPFRYDLMGNRCTKEGSKEFKKLKMKDRWGTVSPIYDKDLSDEEFEKTRNRITKIKTRSSAVRGGIMGMLIPSPYNEMGHLIRGDIKGINPDKKYGLKSRLKTAAAASAISAGVAASTHFQANKIRKKLKSDDPKYDKFKQKALKRSDRAKVLEGKMTAEEFNKKHYNE